MSKLKTVVIILIVVFALPIAFATEIPGGRYIVGEDIPEGTYTISVVGDNSTYLSVWGAGYDDYSTDGGLLVSMVLCNDTPMLGRIDLKDGNVIDFDVKLDITNYAGIVFNPETRNEVCSGRYVVGEDIPAGSYSISVENSNSTYLSVWGSEYDDYTSNGGLLVSVVLCDDNTTLGKVTLEDGNIIDFSCDLIFEPYVGFVIE